MFRRGWALARARPWNDQTVATASLRLERGSAGFLADCACFLTAAADVAEVLSPALPEAQTRVWRNAGFEPHLELVVYERPLAAEPGGSSVPVTLVNDVELTELAAIDDRAFPERWRVGSLGLADALTATSSAQVLTVRPDNELLGFAIVGEMGGVAYLQRLTVAPEHSGRGIGRALVRESVAWARRRGARTILLNTQPENRVAASLYTSEGFVAFGARLQVMRWDRPSEGERTE